MEFVTIVENKRVIRSLDNLITLLSPPGAAAFLGTTIGPYLAKRAKQRFDSEGDDVTGLWASLKPATIVIRHNQGYPPGPINRRTGELEEWVVGGTGFSYPTGFGASLRFPKDRPAGELRKKVMTAQKGKKKDPPTTARPVLGVNETDLIFLQTSLAFAVEQAIV